MPTDINPAFQTEQRLMWQAAPYPENLARIVPHVSYKDWSLNLDTYEREVGGEGLTLRIRFPAVDHSTEDRVVFLIHDFEVPARKHDDLHWLEWIFGCIMLAEKHESMELFRLGETRPFFPQHDMEADMYAVRHTVHRRSIG